MIESLYPAWRNWLAARRALSAWTTSHDRRESSASLAVGALLAQAHLASSESYRMAREAARNARRHR